MDILRNYPVRILDNGAEITDEVVIENGREEIKFEFELATTDFNQFLAINMLPGKTLLGKYTV